MKLSHTFIFEGGVLNLYATGHGALNGEGCLTMALDDLSSDMIEGTDQQVFRLRLQRPELKALRDFLNKHLPE